jgi:hypothetical protein
MATSILDEILTKLNGMAPDARAEAEALALDQTKNMVFIPQPGPQTQAYLSKADVLLFGGSPGGGKTALGVGLALNEHTRSLIVRKEFVDLDGVIHTLSNVLKGDTSNLVGGNRPEYRKANGIIHFQGLGKDIDGKQGNPHDYIYVDEAAQLPEDMVRMLIGWLRTDIEGQRCRVVLGSNPPLNAVGDWLITYFGPWLDDRHPNPAKEGELRYFLPTQNGLGDRECKADDFIYIEGVKVMAQSRTYISSKFTDNKYYDPEAYAKSLSGLPPSVRNRLISGNFLLARPDAEMQCIPTDWVIEANNRWEEKPPQGVPMCAIGADVAQGGTDKTVLAIRYDGWYAPLKWYPGVDTPDGKAVAGKILMHRRDNATVVVDLGGGWGGDCYGHLKENQIESVGYMGVKASNQRTKDRDLKFTNVRTEAYWRFREALDPSQEQGSTICLPNDTELKADLTTPTYEVTSQGIKLMSKEKVKEILGRSPDKGDAVVMAWWAGLKQRNIQGGFKMRNQPPKVIVGHEKAKRRR